MGMKEGWLTENSASGSPEARWCGTFKEWEAGQGVGLSEVRREARREFWETRK